MGFDAVNVSHLVKYYTAPQLTRVLDDVSFRVTKGEIFGLLGENGAGKTTLVKVLSTLLTPDGGHASVYGYDVEKEPGEVRRVIGYAGQDSEKSAYWRLTARENLIYFSVALRGMNRRDAETRIDELAKGLDFSKLDSQFSSLSGGEKQMVIIMRALVHQPKVIFMDEPSKSLDPLAAKRVRGFVRKLVKAADTAVMLTTHNMEEAEELCDEIAFLDGGRLVFVGSPREFKEVRRGDVIILDADLSEYSSALESMPDVIRVAAGPTSKIFVDDAAEALRALLAFMRENHITAKLRVEGPSLEDAYLEFATRNGGARVARFR